MKFEVVPIIPFDDGVNAGKELGVENVRARTEQHLSDPHLRGSLGAMERGELARYTMGRLETPPDFDSFPELQDIYPERVDYLRGFAQGAECSLAEAALFHYAAYRLDIESWHRSLQCGIDLEESHCSGVLLVGPDGVLGAHSVESGPKEPMPEGFRHKPPKPYRGLKTKRVKRDRVTFRKPRTGYITAWGTTNEMGVGVACGTSCSTHLDDPIEDTWPIGPVPILRFARNIGEAVELMGRYTLHNWNRSSQIWADTTGDAVVIEKSFRRVGFRRIDRNAAAPVVWCTEGYFHDPQMQSFMNERRADYLRRTNKHQGSGDTQYFTDCAVRFTNIGRLCHEPWGLGEEHMRRVLTDHSPFPRAVCRHAGADTAEYDRTITQRSHMVNFTANRAHVRDWVPWKKFACEATEQVTQYPPRPGEAQA